MENTNPRRVCGERTVSISGRDVRCELVEPLDGEDGSYQVRVDGYDLPYFVEQGGNIDPDKLEFCLEHLVNSDPLDEELPIITLEGNDPGLEAGGSEDFR